MTNPTDPRLPERIRDKFTVTDSGCWEWTAFIQDNGYGKVAHNDRTALAHRVTYELLVGPIPDGLVIDHLCRVRHCVNPHHLRAVTQRENTLAEGSLAPSALNAAKARCPRGHPLTGRAGHRRCMTCERTRDRNRWPQRSAVRSQRRRSERLLPEHQVDRLVADITPLFNESDRFTTAQVLSYLEHHCGWTKELGGKSQRERALWLSNQLSQRGIRPKKFKLDDKVRTGFMRSSFDVTAALPGS